MTATSVPPTAFTLYDLSGSLGADNEFRDADANCAYYCQIVKQNPLSTKIIRLADWRRPPDVKKEPWTAWLYFTSNETAEGYVKIGTNAEPSPMRDFLRKKTSASSSRYFTGLDSRTYKWKPASRSFHCYDVDERLLARYEYCVDDAVFAKLEIKLGAERMVTEIIATLLLNRHALRRAP